MYNRKYDVDAVTRSFLNNEIPERAALVQEIGEAVRSLPIMRKLGAEVVQEVMSQPGMGPEGVIAIGILYGAVLGICLEKEKSARRIV
jgi:hypothetical protein